MMTAVKENAENKQQVNVPAAGELSVLGLLLCCMGQVDDPSGEIRQQWMAGPHAVQIVVNGILPESYVLAGVLPMALGSGGSNAAVQARMRMLPDNGSGHSWILTAHHTIGARSDGICGLAAAAAAAVAVACCSHLIGQTVATSAIEPHPSPSSTQVQRIQRSRLKLKLKLKLKLQACQMTIVTAATLLSSTLCARWDWWHGDWTALCRQQGSRGWGRVALRSREQRLLRQGSSSISRPKEGSRSMLCKSAAVLMTGCLSTQLAHAVLSWRARAAITW
jgi:hypothetical protein